MIFQRGLEFNIIKYLKNCTKHKKNLQDSAQITPKPSCLIFIDLARVMNGCTVINNGFVNRTGFVTFSILIDE